MHRILMLLLGLSLFCANASAEVSPANLAGMKQVHERVTVALNLKDTGDLAVDPTEIVKIVQQALRQSGLEILKSSADAPRVSVDVSGSGGMGGDTGSHDVTLSVSMTLPSPFRKERSITPIL